jgi:ABC-2 type transport system permease protein
MSALGVTPARVLRSEWIKLTSLRSIKLTFLAALGGMIAFGVLVAWATADNWATWGPGERAAVAVDEVTLAGRHFAQLAIGVVGVIAITGEYATGMIRATLAAVPRRLPVLWAKLAIFAAATFVLMTVAAFASFFAGNAVLSQHWDFTLSDAGVPRAVLGSAVGLTLVCLLGTALGGILRNTAAAISTLFGILMVLPLLGEFLPDVAVYLPTSAIGSLATARIPDGMLEPLPALLVLCGYVGAAIGGAAFTLLRKDA